MAGRWRFYERALIEDMGTDSIEALERRRSFPLKQRLDELAAQAEIQGLVQHSFFRPHLAEILAAFSDAQVPLIVLKGAALAETIYPRPSLRVFGDLDVLIQDDDSRQARAILEGLAYVVDPAQWDDLVRQRDCQANFFRQTPRGPVVVELHTRLVNNDLFFPHVSVPADGLWSRALPVRLAGSLALTLGTEDQLLHLCLHLAGHYMTAPQSLRDIAQVCVCIENSLLPVDWSLFAALAKDGEALPACYGGLFLAKRLLDAPVPMTVLESLSPGPAQSRLELLATQRAIDLTGHSTEHLRLPLLWQLLGRPSSRLRAGWRILFPSHHWLIQHYYYERYDTPEPPRWPQDWRVFFTLYALHGAALVRRASAILFRRA